MFFRAFYAIPQTMRGPGGHLVNAVRGTLDTLARYVTDRKPRHVAFTTDEDWRPDWRGELIPADKQQRTAEPIPPPLIPQVPIILAALEAGRGGGGGGAGHAGGGHRAAPAGEG